MVEDGQEEASHMCPLWAYTYNSLVVGTEEQHLDPSMRLGERVDSIQAWKQGVRGDRRRQARRKVWGWGSSTGSPPTAGEGPRYLDPEEGGQQEVSNQRLEVQHSSHEEGVEAGGYNSSLKVYADDLMNGISAKSKEDLIEAMGQSCERLGRYCLFNFLQLNTSKTHFLYLVTLRDMLGGS